MRKALAVAAVAATLLSTAPAHAATPDPVRAVRQQFAPGHGVHLSGVVMSGRKGKKKIHMELTGSYAFGTSGVTASDITIRSTLLSRKPTTWRLLFVGSRIYAQTDEPRGQLPEGKTWVRLQDSEGGRKAVSFQPVDIFRLPQLKALLSFAGPARNGVYRGTLTGKQASKITKGWDNTGFSYRLSIGPTGLPTRLHTTYTGYSDTLAGSPESADTRYSGWGDDVTIVDPPDHEVISSDDLTAATLESLYPELQEIPDRALGSIRQ
ncbi:hypothetical protein ACU635_57675 [[Actinomadura] parvosata]|uniref:hypothetical protein n=1 Tax=[Actinomadura] parvosata TaxID=1955412 RepID=UPI00406D5017